MKMDPWKTTPNSNDNDNHTSDDNDDSVPPHLLSSAKLADTASNNKRDGGGGSGGGSGGGGGGNEPVGAIKSERAELYGPDYIIDFIRRVQTVPYLYNPDDENFRNVTAKQAAWRQISEEFGQQQNWCMKKWVSLRDYFVKRKKLIRMGKPARPWVYYNELKFLDIIYGPDEPDLADKSGQSQSDSQQGGVNSYLESYYDSASNSFLYVDDGGDDNEYEVGTYITAESEEPDVKMYVPSYPPTLKAAPNVARSSEKRDAASSISSGTPTGTENGTKRRRVDNSRQQSSSSSSSRPHVVVEQDSGSGISTGKVNFREQASSSSINSKRRGSKNVQVEEVVEANEMDEEEDSEDVSQEYLLSPSHGAGGMAMGEAHQYQDAYDLFCLSIAAHMRNMPKARAMQLQVKIMELMYNTEFPQYE